jgi:putative transposase
MLLQKAYKSCLKLNQKQISQIAQVGGTTRFVWNLALAFQFEILQATGKIKSYADMCKLLTQWKRDPKLAWLNEAPSQSLQQTLKHLDRAFRDYFNNKVKEVPRFKKRGEGDSFKALGNDNFKVQDNKIRLPKIGWVRFYKSQEIEGEQKNLTVTQCGDHWFVSIQVELVVPEPVHPSKAITAVGMGVVSFLTTSDGATIEPLNIAKRSAKKLAQNQRKLARKIKGSHNWIKQKKKIARIHTTIANTRKDFLHKITTNLGKAYSVVAMEDLKVVNMSASAKGTVAEPGTNVAAKSGLNKAILDQGWSEFKRQLTYKQLWRGGKVILVSPHNTSRKCSACGHIDALNRSTQAKFLCLKCSYRDNADVNAAKNILAAGHAVLASRDIRHIGA